MTALLTQVHVLREQVEQLARMFATLKNPLIEHIVARTQDLEDAVKALPDDPEATRWWLWHSQAHNLRNLLTPIQGYTRLMQIQPSHLGMESFTEEQNTQFDRVNACGNVINDTISVIVTEMRSTYQTHAEKPPQPLSLTEALAPVWPILRYNLRETAVILVPQIDAEMPPVLYHPLHTTALIQYLVSVMGREWMAYGHLIVRSIAEVETAAIQFAASGLRVSQEQWEGLFKGAGDEVYYRRMVATGGRLDLLTPQGTQEGGIVLRLPWANQNDETEIKTPE